jgi:hypothetical protein
MTRDELWKLYCDRNPSFSNDGGNVTLGVRGLKKLFEQTWEVARKSGFEHGMAARETADQFRDGERNPVGDFLRDLFG